MTTYHVSVLGGGQLARMMQQAAISLDIELKVLAEAPDGSAAKVVPTAPVGDCRVIDDVQAVLAEPLDVITFEHEHVPDPVLKEIQKHYPVRPRPEALIYAQDKLEMRQKIAELGLPVPAFKAIETNSELETFIDQYGPEVVVKTTRGGYDGKGVRVVSQASDIADWLSQDYGLIAEQKINFSRELAVLVARRPSGETEVAGQKRAGEMKCWPITQTEQRDGVCYSAIAPAPNLDPKVAEKALEAAQIIAAELDVTGVLAVEMFLCDDEGTFYINELAMRPHNSGHWTIDGAHTSQFAQHLRAVLDLPLTSPELSCGTAVMVNLLGSNLVDPAAAIGQVAQVAPEARVHLYGKGVRPGRKLGHVTVTGTDYQSCLEQAERAVNVLKGN
ncbi:5-(carboxyamino)imidazole ribonucleotide synthase [Boudabousia liubingyangii]|uniref:N5-carboxyaminoimidazole ribonucleotide synthase n=1 Tax=Boudabousia liubingyangii TaxID=1921764 RepID=A0A1Q5PKX9_9ACTO|nr:5-(carboxyamino)imidazole ribonucleotide synthase [Boudabousia liubingyangii]OKL46379.1 5-(carboxyamino)imidazole ribonucleotide synthase [Boudabousia liubingyangii]OKL47298.1 5-(carboxyamino)imidazole ribonucleotide synthase [Boudabousia liubingyangii]